MGKGEGEVSLGGFCSVGCVGVEERRGEEKRRLGGGKSMEWIS